MPREILLNGRFVSSEEATISVEDRGLQFSEGIYEVIRAYRGRLFEMDRHMRRFQSSAEGVGIDLGALLAEFRAQSEELLQRSGFRDALLYMQATAGVHPRAHLRPQGLRPNTIAIVGPFTPVPDRWLQQGISAITVPDDRWARCYVKTTMLVPNTSAKKRAVDAGCDDAVFVRDGFLTEATAANVCAVFDGVLSTPPAGNYILHGVTREVVLELASELSIPTAEVPIPVETLYQANELFITGTASECVAITTLDGKKIGDGRPGQLMARLKDALQKRANRA